MKMNRGKLIKISVILVICLYALYRVINDPYDEEVDKSGFIPYFHQISESWVRDGKLLLIPPDLDHKFHQLASHSLPEPSMAHVNNAVFVTAADTSHFKESQDSIASFQKHFPDHKIIFYDLGLWGSEIRQVVNWCGVTYQRFNFSKYLPHFKRLQTYAWKPLIIQEVLQHHDTVVWFDSSVRVKCSNMLSQLEPTLKKSGIAMVDFAGHSSFVTTDKRMYEFLDTDMDLLRKDMMGASFITIINSRPLFENVLKWWIYCSLERDCIAPLGSTIYCSFKDRVSHAGCHRYDQSALNLLLVNYFKGDVDMYRNRDACISVERDVTHNFQLELCPKFY